MHFIWYSISSIVYILVLLYPLLTEFNALVATAYNMSLHNHEPPKPERQLHLGDIYHYYSHSYLPFIWQCFGGSLHLFLLLSLSHSLDEAELKRSAGYKRLRMLSPTPLPLFLPSNTSCIWLGGNKRYICIIEFKTLAFLVFVVISKPLVSIFVASLICYRIYYQ